MSPNSHPDLAEEQAYVERVHRAELGSRERAEHAAEAAPDRASARAQRQAAQERLGRLVDPEKLCFGSISLEDGDQFYIGRGAVHEGSTLLVVNWRLPKVSAFYEASMNDSCGLRRRRRFELDELRLRSIVDDELGERTAAPSRPRQPATRPAATPRPAAAPEKPGSEAPFVSKPPPAPDELSEKPVTSPPPSVPVTQQQPEAPVPEPTFTDAILLDMDRARGSEMRDIVATIERRQYELISDAIDGVLVIQGGPGSGKTAIALHRAAWLLYNHRDELERAGALVVGPNRAFMEYVAKVLPSLGESAVTQSAIDRLVELPDVRVRADEPAEVARLKGDPRMAAVVQRACRARIRPPGEDTEIAIDRVRVTVSVDEMRELIASAGVDGRGYLAARQQFRQSLHGLVAERVAGRRSRFRSGPDDQQVEQAVLGSAGVADRVWPSVTAPEVIRDLFNSAQRIDHAGRALDNAERRLLYRARAQQIGEEAWTSADIALLDEAHEVIGGRSSSFGYVLVDEAQDLSPMQLRMVFRRAQRNRATLVGDIAQSTGVWRYPDWDDLLHTVSLREDGRIAELAIGYRVPAQIMELANELLPRIAPDILVTRAVRAGAQEPRMLQVPEGDVITAAVAEIRDRFDSHRSLGVIVPEGWQLAVRAALDAATVDVGEILTDGLSRPVTLLSAEQAKGLEFDHVVVLEPADIAGEQNDWARVYVALTRATQALSVVFSTVLPFEHGRPVVEEPSASADAEPALPAPTPVERLSPRFTEALMRARFVHEHQARRGTTTPYFAHLQAVCALVLEDGGSEDEAIAALLHDAVEDYGGRVLDDIDKQFGIQVAEIVLGCTDPIAEEGMSWRDMKRQHLRELEAAGPLVRRVSLAEKLDNARALLRDYRRWGDDLWERMEVDRDNLLWYVSALADLFATERPGDMAFELKETVGRVVELAGPPAGDQPETDEVAIPAATSR